MGTLSIAAIAVLFVMGAMRPMWCLAIITLMFPIEQLLQGSSPIFLARPYLGNVLVGALALTTVVRLSASGRGFLLPFLTPTLLATIGLYLWASLSLLWTFAPEYLLDSMRHAAPYFIVLVLLAPTLVSEIRNMKEFRIAVLIIGTVIALLILFNPNFRFYGGRYVLSLDAVDRSNPLEIGALGGVLILAAALGSPRDGMMVFLIRCAAFVIGLGIGLLSGSRGEVLAAITIGLLFLPLARKIVDVRQFMITAAAAVTIVVGIAIVQTFFIGIDNRDRWSLESLTMGGGGRFENVADLASNYLQHPGLWPIGLGSTSFHDLPTSSGDPYSHVLLVDLVLELGIPGIMLGGIMLITGFAAGRALLARTASDPALRSGMGFLVGMASFEFIVANKAGTMWGNLDLPCCCCLLARLLALPNSDDEIRDVERSDNDIEEESAAWIPDEQAHDPQLLGAGER